MYKRHNRDKLTYAIDPHNRLGDQNGPAPTICELHRRLWRLVEKKIEPVDPETAKKLKDGLAAGYDMGKRMSVKLEAYKSAGKMKG